MLIAYSRFWQEGIEKLDKYSEPVKDEKTGHYYFDDFRISLQYLHNANDNTSGVGSLIFAPNGLIWCQQGYYCYELDKYGSLYYAIDQVLEEAEKSKAKNLTIFVEDRRFAKAFKYMNPYNHEEFNKLHVYIIEKLKKYHKCQIIFRNKYPKDVLKRLHEEAKKAAQAPEFNGAGTWVNQTGKIYFNIKEQTEEEMKAFAEQWARIHYDFMQEYVKEFIQDYGEEAFKKLAAKAKAGKLKSLPDVKRVKEKKERYVEVSNYPNITKAILCQKCKIVMVLDRCLMKYPEKHLRYFYRCAKCKATKELNEKGRVLQYGKYPAKILKN